MRALNDELCRCSNNSQCSVDETHLLRALKSLNEKERSALFLRFWVPCSIEEVSRHMHISWLKADRLLESTLQKLREDFRQQGLLP